MISDQMLREAAMEVNECILAGLPEDCEHTFSVGFEKKMKTLLRRAAHPVCWQVLRYAVAAVVAVTVLFGSLVVLSPRVRAKVFGWVKETSGGLTQYHYVPDAGIRTVDRSEEFYLDAVPEGYSLWSMDEQANGMSYIYANKAGQFLEFFYRYGEVGNSVAIGTKDCEHSMVEVDGAKAEVYLSPGRYQSSAIVWYDEDGSVLFCIQAFGDAETLSDLAENVKTK